MQANKPLPHLTIRSGPWAGTMVRFATVEQWRAVLQLGREYRLATWDVVRLALERELNAPQPKES